jgi:hypothetical protein
MIPTADLESLEAEVVRALEDQDASGLRILGHGEISLVLGWPPDDPRVACKRLPPFPSSTRFEAYAAVVRRYVEELRAGGIRVIDTELHRLVRSDGRVIGFHVQPVLPTELLGVEVLRSSAPDIAHPLVPAVVDAVVGVTTDRLGVDAQLSNWVWMNGEPWQLDLTTPFLLEQGNPAFDLSPFLAALPAVIRPVVQRQMVELVHRWTSARGALLDMAANVRKEGLDEWLDPVLHHINSRVEPEVTRDEVLRVNASDARLWPVLLRLERANRWWQRRVRHRTYEFLLPRRTTYEERRLVEPDGRGTN